ncbi:MAG: hypothetical protein RLZZ211_197 [Bacteroidota bacterium]|jgi:hypothetical protein
MTLRTRFLFLLILSQIHIFGQTFKINFSQGNQTFLGDSTRVIELKKQPFVIAVELDSLDGVFVHCSERPVLTYGAMKRNIPDFENIGWKVSVETEFNRDQELFLNTINDYCYWFYDAQKYWHRFDSSVVVKSNLVQAQKTIAQLYSIEQEKNVALSEAPNKIYMTLFTIKGSFDEKTAVLDQVRIYELIFRD